MIFDEKELAKYKKLLDDFEVFDKISDVFVSVAKCINYTLTDERGKDVTEEIIKEEISIERIDVEVLTLMFYKELEKWMHN